MTTRLPVLHVVLGESEHMPSPDSMFVGDGPTDVILHVRHVGTDQTDVHVIRRNGEPNSYVITGPCGCR